MSTFFSSVPLRPGYGSVKGYPRSSRAPYFGLQYRGEEEVMTQIGEDCLRWSGPYGYTVMRWSLRGKRYQVKE